MYVKVTAGNHPFGQRGDFLTRVHPPLYSDFAAIEISGMEWNEDGSVKSWDSVDWAEVVGPHQALYMLEFQPDQTEYERNKGIVAFRYARWDDPSQGGVAVVTTRNIFIVGENGKTIDRV